MNKIPNHIGFIMDGNGRWAKARGLMREAGHREGVKTLKKMLEYTFGLGVNFVTVYALSEENLKKRPKSEIDGLFKLLQEYLDSMSDYLVENKVGFNLMGNVEPFPTETQKSIESLLQKTAQFKDRIFSVAFNYGGRAEIVRAVNLIIKSGIKEVDEYTFEQFLYSKGIPSPDLIIRTSGEQRLSNFLLYQSAYSEFYFTKTLWPDFSKQTLNKALDSYNKRKRKFGAITPKDNSNE